MSRPHALRSRSSPRQLSFPGTNVSDSLATQPMRGFVPTPDHIVDLMVEKLFARRPPSVDSVVLDPGCGLGAFELGIVRWCRRRRRAVPRIIGVEHDPCRARMAEASLKEHSTVKIVNEDFLARSRRRFDYVIGNPPYVPITRLSVEEKTRYRTEYDTARGRFDLYLLFFEQSLRLLRPGGRLVFITPEKFLYVNTAEPLRRILASLHVPEIRLVGEETFGDLVTYPTITTVDNEAASRSTSAVLRTGESIMVRLPSDGSSLLPLLGGCDADESMGATLADACLRVSCGVATGADEVFVHETRRLTEGLLEFAHPTIAGRQLVPGQERVRTVHSMLIPYDAGGNLLPLDRLGEFASFLRMPTTRSALSRRTCARRKPWHAFHDSVPLNSVLRPKLLCKDIGAAPMFWLDRSGTLVPRHSVYYMVPRDPSMLEDLASYLNSRAAQRWLVGHCQRAANGFIRLQSSVLKRLPVPRELVPPLASAPFVQRGRPAHAALVLSGQYES